jgi:protein-S-isoprenylcysteine O-methyltransferase Ste14
MMIYNQYFSFKAILSLLIYGFLLMSIPLLGWGIDDLTKFFANPVRVIFLLSIVSAWFMPPNTLSDGVKDKLVNRQKVVLWLSIFLYAIMFTLLPYCERHNLLQIKADNSLRYVAVVNFIIGVIISFWNPIHLCQQYSFNLTLQEGHKLVTDGLFSYIRHPRYLGLILWVLGVSLIYLSIVGLVLTGVLTLLLAWRIYYDEEKLLQPELGQQGTNYFQQTKRIITLIY